MLEGMELFYWVRKWAVVNTGLIHFSRESHALFPFALRGGGLTMCSMCAACATTQAIGGPHAEIVKQVGEDICAAFIPAGCGAETSNVSELYATVYTMLTSHTKVDHWPLSLVLQHLLVSSVTMWVQQLCLCTGGQLRAPSSGGFVVSDGLLAPQLTWPDKETNDLWEALMCENRNAWLRGMCGASHGGGMGCDGKGPAEDEVPSEPDDQDVIETLVTFVLHFHRMRWFLKVVFLRLDMEFDCIAWRILQSSVRAALEHNGGVIEGVLCRIAESRVGSVMSFPQCCLCSDGVGASQGVWERDVSRVSLVLKALDECGAQRIDRAVTEYVDRLCWERGYLLAAEHLGPFCRDNARSTAVENISEVLNGCMVTLERLRILLAEYFGCTELCPGGSSGGANKRVAVAIRSFLAGVNHENLLCNFVRVWALPLLLHGCEGEGQAHQRAVAANRGVLCGDKPCADDMLDKNLGYHLAGGGSSRPVDAPCPSPCAGASCSVRCSHSGACFSTPAQAGFKALVSFFSSEAQSLAALEAALADSVREHLELLLRGAQGRSCSQLSALPQAVYQRCVFLLRFTGQMVEQPAATSSAGIGATVRAIRKGMQAFFVPREPSVILALASALNAQVNGERQYPSRDGSGSTYTEGSNSLEAVETILEFVSLVHSKDLFVDCYCGLLAARLMRVRHAHELDADVSVVSRLSARLGEVLAAQPLALLRDTHLAMVSPLSVSLVSEGMRGQNGTSCHARVLCGARWGRYAPLAVKTSEMGRLLDGCGWFDATMLQAAEVLEEQYKASFLGGLSNGPVSEPPARGVWSAVLFAGSEGIPAARDEQCTAQREDPPVDRGCNRVSQRQRLLSWSLGSGTLTLVCGAVPEGDTNEPAVNSLQLVVPPVGLLVLQALDKHDQSSTPPDSNVSPLTFDALHRALPVDTPKLLLGSILRGLVRHHIVARTALTASDVVGTRSAVSVNAYGLARTFSGCRKHKIVIDVTDTSHHWLTLAQADSLDCAATDVVCGTVGLDRMKRLEAEVVRIVKSQRRLLHTDLTAEVAKRLQTHFVVTGSMLKQCISQLMARDFIAREGNDTYVYIT